MDGTKPVLSEAEGIHANASRHRALSYGYTDDLEAQLKAEIQERLALAEAADGANVPDGTSLPEELERREARLAAIAAAKVKLEARATERDTREQAEYEAKLAARAAKATASGRKPGGKPPAPPTPGPRPNDQINLTDEESSIMPVASGGFDQCDNAQALVDTETLLAVSAQVTQATNDKQQIAPMLKRLAALLEDLPPPTQLTADTGFFSEASVVACDSARIEPPIAIKRDKRHPHWSERFANPPAPPSDATPVERMVHRLRTPKGRATDALRKQTVEPVFGSVKSAMGFRQFLTRGLDNVRNEWNLVCLAWSIKRMAVLRPQ